MIADAELLFGLLALQNGLVTRDQLVAAFAVWTTAGRSMADIMAEQGALDPARRALLEALLAAHLNLHAGDTARSLAALDLNGSTREKLAAAGGADIEASLTHVGIGSSFSGDVDHPSTFTIGSTASDCQRFRVLRPHAQGGLGAVFVALDSELNREVALKQILEHHADDPVSRQRFVMEAEITGGLEHPGIVPVYGLGTYDGGRPYYAMRFIKGGSLREAIERFHADASLRKSAGRRSLELRKLLRRFLDVCNAIEYAHSRGVLHRDIKPGNVIVGKYGETLVVDWGIAKPLGRDELSAETSERTFVPTLSSGSVETLPGSAVGTPAYMSPEAAVGDLQRLGPASDVYSLGASLYSLLTGQPPTRGDRGEVLRRIRLGAFPRPRLIDPSIDPALEAVCLKAMALKPEERYPSCRALADDIERWTADEPVTAYREPFARRARRWAKRNRTAVTGVAATLVAGVIGLSTVLAVQTKANAELSRSKAAVQARYDVAVEAIRRFHTGVSGDFLLKQDQFKEVRNGLLKSAAEFYGRLGALLDGETDFASRRALAQANFEVADLTINVGLPENALAAHRAVLARREALAADPAADVETKVDIGRSLTAIASLLTTTNKMQEAEAAYRKAETLLADVTRSSPSAPSARTALARCRSQIGALLYRTGRSPEALAAYRLARADQELLATTPGATNTSRRDLANTIDWIGILLSDTGKPSEAEFREAMALRQKLVDENPADIEFLNFLAISHNNLGIFLSNMGKLSESEIEYQKGIAIQQKLAHDHPAFTDFRRRLANSHNNLGALLKKMDKMTEAEAEHRISMALLETLAEDNPGVPEYRSMLALSHDNLGKSLADRGNLIESAIEHRKAMAILRKLADDNPTVVSFRGTLASSHVSLGIQLWSVDKKEAEIEIREALALYQELVDGNPTVPRFRSELAITHINLGIVLTSTGELTDAEAEYRKALALQQKLADDQPDLPDYQNNLANTQTILAGLLRNSGRRVLARAACERARALQQTLVKDYPNGTDYCGGLAQTYLRSGQVQVDDGDLAAASATWRRAIALHDGLKSPNGELSFSRSCCHAALAGIAGRPGSGVSAEEGRDESDRAMSWLRRAVALDYRDPDTYRRETALDPLRDRNDFRLLMMDLAMPADPFARGN
jgi:tetratricopeptide (TPR) repeat protein/tRNA A-37 threonylcarbamoyl transferase component Bud32